MPRDYKHRATRRKRRSKLSPLVGIGSGLLLGLFVAFLVYLKLQAPAEPPAFFQESLLPPVEETRPDVAEVKPQAPPPPPKPRFDFYTLLPEMEVVVPDEEIAAPRPAPVQQRPAPGNKPAEQPATPVVSTPAATAAGVETYLLQVGSFRNGEQAERFKAELALLGMETSIQRVTIDNKDTYHRVRVGPFRETGSLNEARSRLSKKGIESRVIKIRN